MINKNEYPERDSKWRKEKIESLHKRLVDPRYHARIPGTLFTAEWRKVIGGNGYQLLCILLRTCDWEKRRWLGNIFQLAAVMGVSDKAVRNQLNQLKLINGFRVTKNPWSIAIDLPERLFPIKASKERENIQKNNTSPSGNFITQHRTYGNYNR